MRLHLERFRNWTAAMCLVLLVGGVCAQRYGFNRFDQRQGLRNIDITSLLQDRQGLIWVGTQAGIYRYDGYRFEGVSGGATSGSLFATGLAEDGRGRVWFSTSDGLGYIEDLGVRELPPPVDGFSFDLANRLNPDPDDPDRIYFVSNHALFTAEFRKGQPSVQPVLWRAPQQEKTVVVAGVLPEKQGRIWLGCGNAICLVEGRSTRVYDVRSGVPAESWLAFFRDSEGGLWARSERKLVRMGSGTSRFVDMAAGLPSGSLSLRQPEIRADAKNRVLINLSCGLARYEAGAWTVFRKGVDLPSDTVRTLLTDRQGSIWLGFDGHGVARWLGYDQFENINEANGLAASPTVWNFARDRRGDLWLATEAGLSRLRAGSHTVEAMPVSGHAALQRVQAITVASDGHIWTGSDNGRVIDYDPVSHGTRVIGEFGGVFQLLPGDAGQLWVCSMNGLFLVDTRARDVPDHFSPILEARVFEGARDRDGEWFMTSKGLFRHVGREWKRIQLPAEYQSTFSAQIAIARDGTLWLTGSRLVHLRVEGDAARMIESFGAPPLVSIATVLVAVDHRGWVWVGSDDGLDIYNGRRWGHVGTGDGLVWNDTDSSAFLEDSDGSVWIGTSSGASHILRPEQLFNTMPPSLYLSRVAIGDVRLVPGQTTMVPWSNRPLTANVSTLDFSRSGRVGFRYHVEGINEDWQDSPKHDLRYPPLAPGRYRLDVMAVVAPDELHSPVTSIDFVIRPPWWRSNGAYAAATLLILLSLIGLWRLSVRRHLANAQRLEEVVRMRTQELETEKAELLRARAALQVQAAHDALTGLLNRSTILQRLQQCIERCKRENSPLGLVLADLDHFKQVNDRYGHLIGDKVLREYAERIREVIRTYDEVGPYGGEEFLIVLPGFDRAMAGERLAALHRQVCDRPFELNGVSIPVTCSFGFAWFDAEDDSVESLIDRADRAMYMAKRNGRNRVEVCEAIEI